MGAPVIARRGGNFVQRKGASLMGAAGFKDCMADDDEGYVRIAEEKSRTRSALADLKRGMRERLLARPAWDIERYTRDFEAGLRQMWRKWCRSRS
jgi:predicted O-linked N-acetylglucosamine transferase (SPINDLY family)